jgi:methionine-rich copper-binding protein CopC
MIAGRRAVSRRVLFTVLSLIALGGAARPISALPHLKLLRSSPAADTVLTTSPDAISLWLSEPVQVPVSKITLATDAGVAIALAPLARDTAKTAPLVAKLVKPIANGAYKVTWKAMSKDGHVVNGTFSFRVRAAK